MMSEPKKPGEMIPVESALEQIRRQELFPDTETCRVSQSYRRVLAREVHASLALPSFDHSAMDGYAVNGASDSYRLVGEIAAGDPVSGKVLQPGEAMRIYTGAAIPAGTTAVLVQEKAICREATVCPSEPVVPGANIRREGEEMRAGDLIFPRGYRINAAGVGLLLAQGLREVEVIRQPQVAVLVTGKELVVPPAVPADGQVYECNGGSLCAALEGCGLAAPPPVHVRDEYEATVWEIERLLRESDVLLITGGISVGKYDWVKRALLANGVEQIFYKVQQKPGKPLFFGRKGTRYVFALPGNPASALTCFYVYVRSLLIRMQGMPVSGPRHRPLAHDRQVKGSFPVFFRSELRDGALYPFTSQSASMLHSFAQGNALVLLSPGQHRAGSEHPVWEY